MKKIVFLLLIIGSAEIAFPQWIQPSVDTLTHNALRDETVTQSLAVNGNSLHAVWKQSSPWGGWRIFYTKKDSAHWTTPRIVGDSSMPNLSPALAVNKATNEVAIAFSFPMDVSDEIFLAVDSADSFLITRITTNTKDDMFPAIAIDGYGNIHLAWVGKDSLENYKIFYATNYLGEWKIQMLAESELGPFGSGASPFIAVNLYGVAHIVYRGGDFGTYQIHHAYNLLPGDTAWQHENISTPNGNDFSAQLVVDDFNTLHLLASGNDGFGFPPHAYYFKKPDAGNWSSPELTTGNGAGWGTSLFIDNHGNAHILWEETSGNIYTGNIFYASNRTGAWVSDSLFCDGKSYGGNLVLDENGFGHALLFNGNTFDTEEILALHSPQPITDVKNDEENPPPQFSLLQNYPNPFNPTTTIRFTLPESRFTSLKIYDIFGKEVATLMNEILPAGNYERNWDATNFPSGMYFYRLTSGQFSQTRKLLLLK